MGRRQVDRQAVAVAGTEMAVVAVAVAVAGLRAKNVQDTSSERRQNLMVGLLWTDAEPDGWICG